MNTFKKMRNIYIIVSSDKQSEKPTKRTFYFYLDSQIQIILLVANMNYIYLHIIFKNYTLNIINLNILMTWYLILPESESAY